MLPSNIIFSIDQYSTNSTSPSKNWKICLSKNHNYSIFQDEHFINTAKGKFLLYIGTSLYYFLIQNKIETNYMLTDSVLMPMRSLEDINHIQLPHTNYHNFNINNNSISYKSIKSDYLYKNINFWDGINNSFLADIFPLKVINRILSDQNKHSIRKRLLPSNMLVYLIIALNLWRQIEIPEVFKVVCAGLAIKCPSFTYNAGFPKQAAISRARSRLGPKVMEELANETLDWLAPVEMKSAWYKDMRLVAIDGTTFDVPDEKINDAYFGRSKTVRGYSAYPQARVLALTEIGTRAIYSGLIGKYKDSEVTMAKELFSSLSKLDANILMLADRGFYGYPLWSKFLETGAKGLWRVKKNLSTRPLTHLPDGSYLSYVYDSKNRKKCDPIKVRIIRSTINFIDENGNEATEIYKFVTNLFDYVKYPAKELAELYHRRWEIEIGFKEIKSNLLSGYTLRSKKPDLVKQEIYGLLLAHFAVSKLICDAAIKKQIQPVIISFKKSINCIHRMLPILIALPLDEIDVWKSNLLDQIASSICKTNRTRKNPRVRKRPVSRFPARKPGTPCNIKGRATVTIDFG